MSELAHVPSPSANDYVTVSVIFSKGYHQRFCGLRRRYDPFRLKFFLSQWQPQCAVQHFAQQMRISQLARAYRERTTTPLEVVERCLATARKCSFGAWQEQQGERALRAALVATREQEAGSWRGPLHGVPFGVKDVIHVGGYSTTAGYMPASDVRMKHTASVVLQLQAAGAILLGKTTCSEVRSSRHGVAYNIV